MAVSVTHTSLLFASLSSHRSNARKDSWKTSLNEYKMNKTKEIGEGMKGGIYSEARVYYVKLTKELTTVLKWIIYEQYKGNLFSFAALRTGATDARNMKTVVY